MECDCGRFFTDIFGFSPDNHPSTTITKSTYRRPQEVCDGLDQAAHYLTLCTKLEAASLSRHMAGLKAKAVQLIKLPAPPMTAS
jgi:hypothetical protein